MNWESILQSHYQATTDRLHDQKTVLVATDTTTVNVSPIQSPHSLNEAVALLGKLGGHLGRAGDGFPGSEVLWRGMMRLADISEAYRLYT